MRWRWPGSGMKVWLWEIKETAQLSQPSVPGSRVRVQHIEESYKAKVGILAQWYSGAWFLRRCGKNSPLRAR